MKIVLIGAGNLATCLGRALQLAKHEIRQVYSRTLSSAQQLADRLDAAAVSDIEEVTKDADLYIISVKDSALESVIRQLCVGREERIFVHTAGSMPMNIFSGRAKHFGVIYPMQTFSKAREVDFREIPIFLEASSESVYAEINELARSISSRIYKLNSADRRYLHLSAVWACNFVNHCYNISSEVLEQKGIPFSVMLPLIDETARKIHTMQPKDAQTGPAVRYDENVIRAQMELMGFDADSQKLYESLSVNIHKKNNK